MTAWLGFALAAVLATDASEPQSKAVYVGYNHLLVFTDATPLSIDVYDYRRNLRPNSTCDVFINPPLLANVTVEDLVTAERPSFDNLEFTYTGFEMFMTQNRASGHYVYRGCLDFRYGLANLPCEARTVGLAPKLKYPWRLAFVGNNRVMFVNELTSEYGVYFLDPDVHSGADPFHFGLPPLIYGRMDLVATSSSTDFAFVSAKSNGTNIDLLLASDRETGRLQAFTLAEHHTNRFLTTKVYDSVFGLRGHRLVSLGEDQIMFHRPNMDYEIFTVSAYHLRSPLMRGINVRVLFKRAHKGNPRDGYSCIRHTPESCLRVPGKCAWCPETKSCFPFDVKHNLFCSEEQPCTNPWTSRSQIPPSPRPKPPVFVDETKPLSSTSEPESKIATATPIVSPHAPQPTTAPTASRSAHNNEDSETDEERVQGFINDYRFGDDDVNGEIRPIKPKYQSQSPVTQITVIESDNADDIVLERKRTAGGLVFSPPAPTSPTVAAGCTNMNADYPTTRTTEVRMQVVKEEAVMNDYEGYESVRVVRTNPPNAGLLASTGYLPDLATITDASNPSASSGMSSQSSGSSVACPEEIEKKAVGKQNMTKDHGPYPPSRKQQPHPGSPSTVQEMEEGRIYDLGDTRRESSVSSDKLMNGDVIMNKNYNEDVVVFRRSSMASAMNSMDAPMAALPRTRNDYDNAFMNDGNVQDFIPVENGLQNVRSVVISQKPDDMNKPYEPLRVPSPIPPVVVPAPSPPVDVQPPSATPSASATPSPPQQPTPTPFVAIQQDNANGPNDGSSDSYHGVIVVTP